MEKEKTRLDKYLWSIRIFKTRGLATEACDNGKVKLHGDSVKPSRAVKIGDEYEIRNSARKWVVRVKEIISSRVQYKEAVLCYDDITPSEELERIQFEAASFHTGKRLSKIGRPSKKDKRDLDKFMEQ